MTKEIELVIFDLDGTLVDAYSAIIQSFNFTRKTLGYPPENPLRIREAVGWGDANLLKPFFKRSDLGHALKVYRRHHRLALLRKSRLFPGALMVLRYLKRKGYKTAVASNRPTPFSRILIRHLTIDTFFDYVLCGDRVSHGKPHPEILQGIMIRFGVRPDETVYVGDMTIDAQAGKRAGVRTVIVTTGSSSRKAIRAEKPYRIINKLAELLNIV